MLLGWILFGFCGGLLWWTNLERFGDGFEFGHQLNVQHLSGAMYATRFDSPFADEPIGSAARDLFGEVFRVRELNGLDFYREGFIAGQSDTLRWRHFYFRTYDLSYAAWLLAGWCVAGFLIGRRLIARGTSPTGRDRWPSKVNEIALLGVWSMLSSALLAGFYLRVSVISSRYMIDFAPAFAAGMLALWFGVASLCRWWWTGGLVCLLLAGWLGAELHLSRSLPGEGGSRSWEEVTLARQARPVGDGPRLSEHGCTLGDPASGIPFDRTGWDQKTGALNPLVIIFVNDPQFLELELELERVGDAEWAADPEAMRAKAGLEALDRVSVEQTENGWRVRFQGPTQLRYRSGIQCVFVATVPNEHLTAAKTPWVLRSVRWREAPGVATRQARD